ncbi:MAG: CHAT domain-containing protein, partial [Pseudanabaena sp. ELA607]
YGIAIEAIEQARRQATTDNRREEIHADGIEIYTNIIQSYIQLNQIDKAIEYAERSRSQYIVDLLHSHDLYPAATIPPAVRALKNSYNETQNLIDRLWEQIRAATDNRQAERREIHRARTEALSEEIAQLEAQKQTIWEQLRRADPVMAGQVKVAPLPYAQMQQMLANQPHTAILYFYSTDLATLVFIIHQKGITLHSCPSQDRITLINFLDENWLTPYLSNKAQWREQMPQVLKELAQRLEIPQILKQIPDQIAELIIVPHLFLHQIPFAALPIDDSQTPFLSDRYRLRTVSSLQILSYCTERQAKDPINSNQYATVENATDDLVFAGFEGEQVAQLFQVPNERRLRGKTQATKANYRQILSDNNAILSSHHASSRIDNPLESILQLGDGFITLGELMMSRYPNLSEIFLSCCETGLGSPKNLTDDIISLGTGFLSAGARAVVSSLWAVNDIATALFSIYYHQARTAGQDRPTALHSAQKALRNFQGAELAKGQPLRNIIATYINNQRRALGNTPETQSQRNKLTNMIQNVIPELIKQAHPFDHPQYWAAFIVQGLA